MGLENLVVGTSSEVILELGKIGRWLETLGLIVVLWIIFSGVTLFFNRKRRKILENMQKDLQRIEKKIDSIKSSKKK